MHIALFRDVMNFPAPKTRSDMMSYLHFMCVHFESRYMCDYIAISRIISELAVANYRIDFMVLTVGGAFDES